MKFSSSLGIFSKFKMFCRIPAARLYDHDVLKVHRKIKNCPKLKVSTKYLGPNLKYLHNSGAIRIFLRWSGAIFYVEIKCSDPIDLENSHELTCTNIIGDCHDLWVMTSSSSSEDPRPVQEAVIVRLLYIDQKYLQR